jgi:hypothetical protein
MGTWAATGAFAKKEDDGFVPFDHLNGPSLKQGDSVRLYEAIVLHVPDTGGSLQIGIGGVVYTAVINSIAAVRRKPPEPLRSAISSGIRTGPATTKPRSPR